MIVNAMELMGMRRTTVSGNSNPRGSMKRSVKESTTSRAASPASGVRPATLRAGVCGLIANKNASHRPYRDVSIKDDAAITSFSSVTTPANASQPHREVNAIAPSSAIGAVALGDRR